MRAMAISMAQINVNVTANRIVLAGIIAIQRRQPHGEEWLQSLTEFCTGCISGVSGGATGESGEEARAQLTAAVRSLLTSSDLAD